MQGTDDRQVQEIATLLAQSPSFASLGADRLQGLAGSAPIDRLPAGECLFAQGEPGNTAYLVIEGEVAVEVTPPAGGAAVTVALLRAGELVGEIAAFAATPRTATVRARTSARFLRIERQTIRALLADNPETAMAVIAELGRRLQSLNGTIATLTRATNALAHGVFAPGMLRALRQEASRFAHFADVFEDMAREIQEKRQRSEEMRTAAEIQRAFLPGVLQAGPAAARFDIAAAMRPARDVGGDFYDYFMIGPATVGLAVGDVSGKGVPAAMFMGVARTVLKTVARDAGSAAEALARVNDVLAEDNAEGMFVTIAFARLDLETGAIDYASGGHEEVFLPAAGACARLGPTGPAVGLFPGAAFRAETHRLVPGDMLVLATDGVTEAFDAAGDMFGAGAAETVLSGAVAAGVDAAGVVAALDGAVSDFAAGVPQSDDVTCLALRYLG